MATSALRDDVELGSQSQLWYLFASDADHISEQSILSWISAGRGKGHSFAMGLINWMVPLT